MSTAPKKHFLHRKPFPAATPKKLPSPETTGALIDLYLKTKELCVVIDNYLVSNSKKEKIDQEDELSFLTFQKFQNLAKAKHYRKQISLPAWKKLPDHLKHVFRTAACGRDKSSIALSCNLSHLIASRANSSYRGAADYIGRKLRDLAIELGLSPMIALTLEDSTNRKGNNPGLHFHAALRVPAEKISQLTKRLKQVFAEDYIEAWNNKAVCIKPIRTTGGWAAYCTATLNTPDQCLEAATFASKQASQAGEELYNELKKWLQGIPTLKTLKNEINSLKKLSISAPACPNLVLLIEQHRARKALARRERCRRTWDYKKQAANDPEVFRRELAERLGYEQYADQNGEIRQTIHSPYKYAQETLYKLEHATISPNSIQSTAASTIELTERYRGHPEFAKWAPYIEQEELSEDIFDLETELS